MDIAWLSYILKEVSTYIVSAIFMEFCMALSPCQVRDSVFTVIMSVCDIMVVFPGISSLLAGEMWVFYVLLCVGLLVFFVIFVYMAKRYKIRKPT